jgi:twinkle protein
LLIPTDLIREAKEKLGEEAVTIIANDLQLKEFDVKNPKSLCPFHDEDTPSFIWMAKSNNFYCYGCGAYYSIIDHYMQFYKLTFLGAVEKLFDQVNIKYSFGEKGIRTRRDYKYPKYQDDPNRDTVDKYFAKRQISKETLDYCDVRQSMGQVIWNFYDENDVLMTVKCRPPRKTEKHEIKEWYLPDYDYLPILFNMNKIDPTQPLVITEGQIDTLSVIESGYKNVVSIPGGDKNTKWLEECYDWLEPFKKIILWFDSDTPGINARKEAAARLGTWRTFFVDLPYEEVTIKNTVVCVKDANAVLVVYGKEKVSDFILEAKEIPIESIKNLADIEEFDLEAAPGLYTQIKPLDKIIYKFIFGNVLLITGKTGSGKSALTNQLFVDEALEQGYDVFYFSGELDSGILKSWININLAGPEKVKMKNEFVRIIDKKAKMEINDWYNNRIFIYKDRNRDYQKIRDTAISVVRKYGAKVVILDNLMSMNIGATSDDNLQKEKDLIVDLGQVAEQYNILIVLVAHPRKTFQNQPDVGIDDIYGAVQLSQASDYAITVRRFSVKDKEGEKDGRGNYKPGKLPIDHDGCIDVIKNRFTGKMDKSMVYFHYPTYRFWSDLDELHKRYGWNKDKTSAKKFDPRSANSPFGNDRDIE